MASAARIVKTPNWFSVDKAGLAKLIEKKGKSFVLFELVQNAWDQKVTKVEITTKQVSPNRVEITITDDDPHGFADLSHAFTLFAESHKKGNAEKRGRFNLGEKLVLALCDRAEIQSTKGSVVFDGHGRTETSTRTKAGTVFTGIVRMSVAEHNELKSAVKLLIQPGTVKTFFNGIPLDRPQYVKSVEESLPTIIADDSGVMHTAIRRTTVKFYKPQDGEPGMIYEMGIPVVETGDAFHVDVQQRVPLNFDRDNVTPAYLRKIRTMTLNALHDQITEDQATRTWVSEALSDPNVQPDAVRTAIAHRFGDKAVVYDPSDPEANKLAVVQGYTVVSGNQLSRDAWDNVRKAGVLKPAGQVTPSPKPFNPDGKPLKVIPETEWTPEIQAFVVAYKKLALRMIEHPIAIVIANDRDWPFAACYGERQMYINKAKLGSRFFEALDVRQLDLLIHELGHEYSPDHLSEQYHDALTKLGARLAIAVAGDPSLLKL